MIEKLYETTEQGGTVSDSVQAFVGEFIDNKPDNDEMKDLFYEAVRDTQLAGFRDGMKVAFTLVREIGLA